MGDSKMHHPGHIDPIKIRQKRRIAMGFSKEKL
jgi:hypothetical protein